MPSKKPGGNGSSENKEKGPYDTLNEEEIAAMMAAEQAREETAKREIQVGTRREVSDLTGITETRDGSMTSQDIFGDALAELEEIDFSQVGRENLPPEVTADDDFGDDVITGLKAGFGNKDSRPATTPERSDVVKYDPAIVISPEHPEDEKVVQVLRMLKSALKTTGIMDSLSAEQQTNITRALEEGGNYCNYYSSLYSFLANNKVWDVINHDDSLKGIHDQLFELAEQEIIERASGNSN